MYSEFARELDKIVKETEEQSNVLARIQYACYMNRTFRENVNGAWFNDPYTTVKWSDGTTTTVRCSDDDEYNMATGFLLCCAKRLFGGGRYLDVMRKLGIDIDREAE